MDQALNSISNFEKIINEMGSIWTVREHDGKFFFVCPELIHSVRWKYDFLIMKKKLIEKKWVFFLELICPPFRGQSCTARVPTRAYSTSAGYDLYVAKCKSLKPRESVS